MHFKLLLLLILIVPLARSKSVNFFNLKNVFCHQCSFYNVSLREEEINMSGLLE